MLVVCILIFALLFFFHKNKQKVTLLKCVDGDTAHLEVNGVDESVRFLAIDTPEISSNPNKSEPFGESAASYTCNALKKADEITLEFEESAERDRYGRLLAWVFVDGSLLQKELISEGYGEVKYVYGDYRYVDELLEAQKQAKSKGLGMWK